MNYNPRFVVKKFPNDAAFTVDGINFYSNTFSNLWGIYDQNRQCFVDIHVENEPHVGYSDKTTSEIVANAWNDEQDCLSLGIDLNSFRKVVFHQ